MFVAARVTGLSSILVDSKRCMTQLSSSEIPNRILEAQYLRLHVAVYNLLRRPCIRRKPSLQAAGQKFLSREMSAGGSSTRINGYVYGSNALFWESLKNNLVDPTFGRCMTILRERTVRFDSESTRRIALAGTLGSQRGPSEQRVRRARTDENGFK
jgi:hypothetical protein